MSAGFSKFIRAVARGSKLGRSLEIDEAETAMGMILDGQAEAEQIGAFLMVLRYRVETAAEIAGFVRAARQRLAVQGPLNADLDWPSYADAHRQLPYFVLAAKLLAQNGVRVLMHGIEGTGTATTRAALRALDMPIASDANSITLGLEQGFAYVPLEALCPSLAGIFDLKPKFELRSCVHTVARELNPFGTGAQIQGVFHPTYLAIHRDCQDLLNQASAITFKGGGGEGQRNPCKPALGLMRRNGESYDMRWTCMCGCDSYPWREEPLDVARVRALWTGEFTEDAPRRAVTGTAAMGLWILDRAGSPEEAESMAEAMWLARSPLQAAA